MINKAFILSKLMFTHPSEFVDRIATLIEVKLDQVNNHFYEYEQSSWNDVVENLTNIMEYNQSLPDFSEIENDIVTRLTKIKNFSPIAVSHNGDFRLGRLCYIVCRIFEPEIVIETGVAHGVTSAYVLQALHENNKGALHSIDLPPLGIASDTFVGISIPEHLKYRWRLHRGVTRKILPKLLPELKETDIFIHDSLHTYKNMKFEFESALKYLNPNGLVISDDIDGNSAFKDLIKRNDIVYSAAVSEEVKNGSFGIALLGKKLLP